ncbi:MAG: hypothetical protein GW783_09140 [Deltaproteobacteria bacterium]|nr:hypothetical protein [Deltaproteobacteria bacterium]NCP95103.1 hypothetical protein [Deltaproteobacteria bacterium]NCS74272.1 hypothetical protein [Deltaproteobacteria bacterium]
MSRVPMPVVVGLLLVLAAVAVVRNVLFFRTGDPPRAAAVTAGPATDPTVDWAADPTTDSALAPVADPATDPTADPTAAPAAEAMVDPEERAPLEAVAPPLPTGPPEAWLAKWRARELSRSVDPANDPFHLPHPRQTVAIAQHAPSLQGVLTGEGRTTALVDGMAVAVGDPLAGGRVAAIAATGVRISTPHGDRWLEFQPSPADALADGGE